MCSNELDALLNSWMPKTEHLVLKYEPLFCKERAIIDLMAAVEKATRLSIEI